MRSVWWLVRSKISNRSHEEAERDEQISCKRYLLALGVRGWGLRGLDLGGNFALELLPYYSMLECGQAPF